MATNNLMVPPIGTKGLYVLLPPFDKVLEAAELYECGAIRYFEDVENNGRSVYDLYYKPWKINEARVATDRQQGHVIVTLLSPKFPPVYVPSSYIKSYPDLSSKPYNQVIMTLSLGALPDDVILDTAANAAANAVSDTIGVNPEVHFGIMPLSDAVTPAVHETREAARQGKIKNRTTDYARLLELENANSILKQQNLILEKIIKDNNLLP
ncbi:hypothetical protein [Pseudomonas phage vB_PaeM_PS119XW]|uniref:Uncharacterized protein n=1 Tax=Pseudomonas phage vB_PaeM_PS119XW TaxID=2601632 RepID=A0A5C1K737_9CAUD|nr:hypothetical protein PP933_gp188 [Pseudomonas phage vB_PaeM_PS119XW]QEM41917.1 hypothetical protein [Pseudomonas phage vB_PaeM_PS119XW]